MLSKMLIRVFTKKGDPADPSVRLSFGILSGYVGLMVNILLFVLKLTLGLISGSIAIAADAVNNLSDAGSAVITLYGFKLSAAPADVEHPFGHGRLEYLAGVIVSVIIISIGIDFLKESVIRIFKHGDLHMDLLMMGLYAGSILFKLWLFLFYRRVGKTIHSQVVMAAAFDSLSDIMGTTVVLFAVALSRCTTFPIDGCAGTLVAVLVVWGGIKVLKDSANPLLGEMPSPELVEKLRKKLLTCRGINGVHGIIMHNYGPNAYFATAHAEIDQKDDLMSAHNIMEDAEVEVAKVLPIRLVLHCDPFDTEDPYIKDWRAKTEKAVGCLNQDFKVSDFSVDDSVPGKRTLRFHLLIAPNGGLSCSDIEAKLKKAMRVYDPELELDIEFIPAYA